MTQMKVKDPECVANDLIKTARAGPVFSDHGGEAGVLPDRPRDGAGPDAGERDGGEARPDAQRHPLPHAKGQGGGANHISAQYETARDLAGNSCFVVQISL